MPYTGSPPTFAAGEKSGVSAKLNQLRDAIRGFSDPWTAYTPTWTQSATITCTGTAAHVQVGKFVTVRFNLTASSAGTAGQPNKLTLPVTAKAIAAGGGSFYYFDAGTAHYAGFVHLDSTTTCIFYRSGDADKFGIAGPTVASGDMLTGVVTYEAA